VQLPASSVTSPVKPSLGRIDAAIVGHQFGVAAASRRLSSAATESIHLRAPTPNGLSLSAERVSVVAHDREGRVASGRPSPSSAVRPKLQAGRGDDVEEAGVASGRAPRPRQVGGRDRLGRRRRRVGDNAQPAPGQMVTSVRLWVDPAGQPDQRAVPTEHVEAVIGFGLVGIAKV
jgi:hypothetical protein